MTDPRWSSARPAFGEILLRLVALRATLDRVTAAQRLRAIEATRRLLEK